VENADISCVKHRPSLTGQFVASCEVTFPILLSQMMRTRVDFNDNFLFHVGQIHSSYKATVVAYDVLPIGLWESVSPQHLKSLGLQWALGWRSSKPSCIEQRLQHGRPLAASGRKLVHTAAQSSFGGDASSESALEGPLHPVPGCDGSNVNKRSMHCGHSNRINTSNMRMWQEGRSVDDERGAALLKTRSRQLDPLLAESI
jgi:hypothetical protein